MKLDLPSGAHVCQLAESRKEQEDVTLSFLRAGLGSQEACMHLASEHAVDSWYRVFQDAGTDVATEQRRGTLEILDALDWYLDGDFQSIIQARRLMRVIDARLKDFRGIRLTADMRWTSENLAAEALCHWEATANLVFEDVNTRTICQYDLSSHSPAEIHAALRTHPFVIYAGSVHANPHYEALSILRNEPRLNGSDADAARIAAMLDELTRATGCEGYSPYLLAGRM
jgi:hypothetical protein